MAQLNKNVYKNIKKLKLMKLLIQEIQVRIFSIDKLDVHIGI